MTDQLRDAIKLATEALSQQEWRGGSGGWSATCLWCGGYERPPAMDQDYYGKAGHKPDCIRQRALTALQASAGDVQRLTAQCREISVMLSDAGIGPCTIVEGVREALRLSESASALQASADLTRSLEGLLAGIGRDYDEPLVERIRWLVLDYEKRGELLEAATKKLRVARSLEGLEGLIQKGKLALARYVEDGELDDLTRFPLDVEAALRQTAERK